MKKVMENAADRHPYDGRPYYCRTCGLAYPEYLACEDGDCLLEGEDAAKLRQQRAA